MGVNKVIIGSGKKLVRKTIFGIPLIITDRVNSGLTVLDSIERKFFKLRFAFFTAGGVLLQCLLTAPCIVLLGNKNCTYFSISGMNLIVLFVVSNLFLIALNLFPGHVRILELKMPNDGLSILTIPFLKEQDINQIIFADRISETHGVDVRDIKVSLVLRDMGDEGQGPSQSNEMLRKEDDLKA